MAGAGIINNSGVMQYINVPAVPQFGGHEESYNEWFFANNATAGDMVQYTVYGSSCADDKTDDAGWMMFKDNATAGSATFIVYSGTRGHFPGQAGAVDFVDSSSAGNATFINNGGLVRDGYQAHTTFDDQATAANATITNYGGSFKRMDGAWVVFSGKATAGNATITNNGGQHMDAAGAQTSFYNSSTAGNATLIANPGKGDGGEIDFWEESTGGTASIYVFGNGVLDISRHHVGIAIGSLQGDGLVYLGGNKLIIGSKNLGTTFSGVIQGTGSVTKTGMGTLLLTSANTYTHGTTIDGGLLLVGNTAGSATGGGPVIVNTGTLGGDGIINGPVTIETGAALAPGRSIVTPGTLTIQTRLQLITDATYRVSLNSDTPAADQVAARGVLIAGAKISFDAGGSTVLPAGTAFTLINNTGSTAISGAFTNLADGGTITVGNNTYQADYEGGDGNDLTLTVVP